MTREQYRVLRILRSARRNGAPFTTQGHPLNATLRSMVKAGILRARVVGQRTYWTEDAAAREEDQ